MNKKTHSHQELEEIWNQVPPDYYQNGIKTNILQRMWHTRKLQIVYKLLKSTNHTPKKILDVGSASGWFLFEISKKFPHTSSVGIDTYKKAIDYGKKRYKFLQFIHADAHEIPFPKESFDTVICTEVLEHVKNPGKVLREIKRVLTPHGYGVIEMDTGNVFFHIAWYWWTHLRHGVWEHAHIQEFNLKKLQKQIVENGLEIKKKKVFNLSMGVAFLVQKNISNIKD